jgi:ubiquinone/menaquinone biosynthesis C-methylase UbiE
LEVKTAVNLIKNGIAPSGDPQTWYDLGAGSGLFTMALASLLPAESKIYAIDTKASSFDGTWRSYHQVNILSQQADFTTLPVAPASADGILMANSLHFVKDKKAFLFSIMKALTPEGRLLLVEYDTLVENPWVPYPVSFEALNSLLTEMGMTDAVQLAATSSKFQNGGFYSAQITAN